MECSKKRELDLMAAKIRKTALQTIQAAGSGHIGGSFSIADILSALISLNVLYQGYLINF